MNELICYKFTTREDLSEKDIREEFGDIYEKKKRIFAYLDKEEDPKIIPPEQLKDHEVAFFENNIEDALDYDTQMFVPRPFSLEDVLVDFEVDTKKETVTAKKLYRYRGKYFMKTRTYDMKNYGKTWRAWTAMPKEHYVW